MRSISAIGIGWLRVTALLGILSPGLVAAAWAWELDTVYGSALYFFDRQEFGQAQRVLERVDPAFYPQVVSHLRMLAGLREIERASRRQPDRAYVTTRQYAALVDAGLDSIKLHQAVCRTALDDSELSMLEFCARQLPGFATEVDQLIASLLQAWYAGPTQRADFPDPLRVLVNPTELDGTVADHELIRRRLVAWLKTNNCKITFRCPAYPKSIRPLVREFVFERE